jgi:hypothetical protein
VAWDSDNGGETLSPWELYVAGSDESNDFAAITLRLALNINGANLGMCRTVYHIGSQCCPQSKRG